ncbi:Chaperone J-domain superfamily [Sesbania bispinosa]|nr:Chaperone J-domain superfamily [Sesbania bispinosa]
MPNSIHIDVDDSHVNEKDSVSNKQTREKACSAKATGRNHYGLFGSESDSSDSDCSDCELMEREQWEKVSAKRKRRVINDQSCHDEHASSSGLHNNNYIDVEDENRYEQHAKGPVYSGPSNGKHVKENQSPFSFKDSDQKVEQENYKCPRSKSVEEMHSFRQSSDIECGVTKREKITPCPKYKNCKFCSGVTGASRFKSEFGGDESKFMSSSQDAHERQANNNGSASRSKDDYLSEVNSNHAFFDVEVEDRFEQHAEGPVYSGPSNDKHVKENQSSFSVKDDGQVDGIYFNLVRENSFKDSDQKVEQDNYKSPRSKSTEEMHSFRQSSDIERGEWTKKEKFTPCPKNKNCDFCSGVTGASRFKNEVGGEESKFMSSSQDACERHVDNNGSASRSKDDNLCEVNSNHASFDERHINGDKVVLQAQDGGLTPSNDRDIINQREMLKETDEYKHAIEEEWASRQRQLQLQAEEAQRLRKRKRAESKRLLDMQRRQKERIEEVRQTQKKDEEFMIMKEQMRVEIRKGLKELEMQCKDMTTLLRGLGIHVGESFIPLPNEVQAACKRALFKFHPDRASKTDIREQVEAEEKFKLISRMKEKFLLTPCH